MNPNNNVEVVDFKQKASHIGFRKELIRGFLDGLKPIERIEVSEWSNKYRWLSNVASARPGRYDIGFTPYLKEIIDCLSELSPISEVVFMKGAQIGATEIGNNWIGYIIHIAPAATLMVMPTDETVRRNSKIRIAPMIAASPVLRARIKPSRARDSGNTTTEKEFPGGVLILTGANSGSALRSLPIKNLMLDEVDGYPVDVDKEGSPVDLAKARTNTYISKRKILIISTPTVDGISVIQSEFADSDQRYYNIPCPHCAGMQKIEWKNIKWEEGKPHTAKLECQHCHEMIEERHKFWMVQNGMWIAENPDHMNKRRRGYHLSALYSTLGYSWSNAVMQFLAAKNNPVKMKAFVNTVLGNVYKENVEAPDWAALYSRRELYTIGKAPASTSMLTMGVDVQRDRIEYEVLAWSKNKVQHSVEYGVLWGDTAVETNDVWKELKKKIESTWVRIGDDAIIPLRVVGVDTSYNTQTCYNFCNQFDAGFVLPFKGRDQLTTVLGAPKSVEVNTAGKPVGTTKVWSVGVSIVKTILYGWLRQMKIDGEETPTGYCHFPMYDEHYFKMLTAEKKQLIVDKKGYQKYEWVLPAHARNEALDCRVYNIAAATFAGLERFTDEDWDAERDQYVPAGFVEPAEAEQAADFLGNTKIW